MLRMNIPELTLDGVKAFAKTLRHYDRRDIAGSVTRLLSDLVNNQTSITLPTASGWEHSISKVSWITGTCGSGKTMLSLAISALAMRQPKRRIVILTGGPISDFAPAISCLKFQVIQQGDYDRRINFDNHTIVGLSFFHESLERLSYELSWRMSEISKSTTPALYVLDSLFHDPNYKAALSLDFEKLRQRRGVHVLSLVQDQENAFFCVNARLGTDDIISMKPYVGENYEGTLRHPNLETIEFTAPDLIKEDALEKICRSADLTIKEQYEVFATRLSEILNAGLSLNTHQESLEATAKILGFSNWHALQGCLKKRYTDGTLLERVTLQHALNAIDKSGYADSDDMWSNLTICTLEALEVARIDIRIPKLFDTVLRHKHIPEIDRLLCTLPGYPDDLDAAKRFFFYSATPAIDAAKKEFGSLT